MLSNYPPGAEHDPNAPYNQWEPEERAFETYVEVTLIKHTELLTKDYGVEYDEETGRKYYLTNDTDWNKAYEDCEPSIIDMLEELKTFIQKELDENKDLTYTRKQQLMLMLESASGWEEETTYVGEE